MAQSEEHSNRNGQVLALDDLFNSILLSFIH